MTKENIRTNQLKQVENDPELLARFHDIQINSAQYKNEHLAMLTKSFWFFFCRRWRGADL